MDSIDAIVEYKRNLNNCISFIEEEEKIINNNENENDTEMQIEETRTVIKGINLENFVRKNSALNQKFKKKNTKVKIGDFVMVRNLKYYTKLNDQVVFICDFDSENFEIIQ